MQVVELGAVHGEVDPVGAEFDYGDLDDVRSDDEREKTRAVVGAYEVGW